jgi:hypothetical protein
MKIYRLAQEEPFNERQSEMVRFYNFCFGQSMTETVESYDQLGRSQGIVQAIAQDPSAFHKFFIQIGHAPIDTVTKYFQNVSR